MILKSERKLSTKPSAVRGAGGAKDAENLVPVHVRLLAKALTHGNEWGRDRHPGSGMLAEQAELENRLLALDVSGKGLGVLLVQTFGHGLWNWKTAYTFKGWINSSDFSRDQAFFTVHPRNGRSLVATVGGNGLSYNYGHNQTAVRIWGWPAEKPYDGATPYYRDGNTKKWSFHDSVLRHDRRGK